MPFIFAKLLQFSTIFKEALQAHKSSYGLDIAHAFTSYPKLRDCIKEMSRKITFVI